MRKEEKGGKMESGRVEERKSRRGRVEEDESKRKRKRKSRRKGLFGLASEILIRSVIPTSSVFCPAL